jgi:hypothetical protein
MSKRGLTMTTFAIAVAIWIPFASLAQANESQIVGTWAADARTKGGLGAMMVFSDAGIVTSTFGAVVDFKYEADGKTIRTIHGKDKAGTEHRETYRIVGDTLTTDWANPDPAKRVQMKRLGPPRPGTQTIVGVWQFMHYTGVPATWQYTTNGLAQLSVPMHTSRGRYTVSGSNLSLAMDRESPTELRIELEGDSLTIFEPKGQRRFTRVVP